MLTKFRQLWAAIPTGDGENSKGARKAWRALSDEVVRLLGPKWELGHDEYTDPWEWSDEVWEEFFERGWAKEDE